MPSQFRPPSPTAEGALPHTWLTSFATLTEHDLCSLRENFNLRACWRNVIGVVRALFRFAKSNGARNNKKDRLTLSADEEEEEGNGSSLPSLGATPEPDSKKQP